MPDSPRSGTITVTSPIAVYLADLAHELRWRPRLKRRVLVEMADHLENAAAAEVRQGAARADAEATAVHRVGPAALVAQRYRDIDALATRSAVVSSCVTMLVALLLLALSWRDRDNSAAVEVLAAVSLVYAGMSAAIAIARPRDASWRAALLLLSVPAVLLGGIHTWSELWSREPHGVAAIAVAALWAMLAVNGLTTAAYALADDPQPAVAAD